MEGEGRGFQPIQVSVCSAVIGKVRFPQKGAVEPPSPVGWRNNLTALSQSRNLYFAAYTDRVHVYKPQFPSQKIGSIAQLVIDLPASRSGLTGLLDPRKPHACNQIIVGDLGNEEILLLACDDGDVLAYTTRSISNAILAKDSRKFDVPAPNTDLKPFFIRNVGSSAWGLAIHKASRMIAVSANTQRITVFAFALHHGGRQDDAEVSESEFDIEDDVEIQYEIPDQVRQLTTAPGHSLRNLEITITLTGHRDNIPSISFCNHDSDQNGRYLVSTDIRGETLIWDIWAQQAIKRHSLPPGPPNGFPGAPRTRNWSVLCLAKECFRATEGVRETFGCEPDYIKRHYDLSNARTLVEDSSLWHPAYSRFSSVPSLSHSTEEQELSDGSNDDLDESNDESVELDSIDDDQEDDLEMGFTDDDSPAIDTNNIEPLGYQPVYAGERPAGARVSIPRREWATATQPKSESLPFSIFCTSETEISLLQDPMVQANVVMTEPLCQHLPPNLHWLANFNRLNMVVQIPELGIVAVASQVGRVALLTLTRMKGLNHCAFRLDWILPFKSQEDQGVRPTVPLLGIAAGPIQGRQFDPESADAGTPHREMKESWRAIESSRRYRLILTYYDHTVLSYEIGRTSNDKGKIGIEDDVLVF